MGEWGSEEHRGSGVASGLIRLLATWFATQKASRICVNVDPTNTTARRFYKRQGADVLNEHWHPLSRSENMPDVFATTSNREIVLIDRFISPFPVATMLRMAENSGRFG